MLPYQYLIKIVVVPPQQDISLPFELIREVSVQILFLLKYSTQIGFHQSFKIHHLKFGGEIFNRLSQLSSVKLITIP